MWMTAPILHLNSNSLHIAVNNKCIRCQKTFFLQVYLQLESLGTKYFTTSPTNMSTEYATLQIPRHAAKQLRCSFPSLPLASPFYSKDGGIFFCGEHSIRLCNQACCFHNLIIVNQATLDLKVASKWNY